MANVSGKKGLRPINQPYGNIRCNYYQATTGVAWYMYQPVDLDANGRVITGIAGSVGNFSLLGSIIGMADDSFGPINNSYSGYLPANPAVTGSGGFVNLLIADDPSQYFVIEENTGSTALTAQAIGAGCNFTYQATSGSTVSGIANVVLQAGNVATTTDLVLRLIKKLDKTDNAYGEYCKWIVSINRHRLTNQSIAGGTLI